MNGENKVEQDFQCRICLKSIPIQLDMEDFETWRNEDAFIQDVLPYLNAGERELLISGTCDDCWKDMFGDPDEDYEEEDDDGEV